MIMSKAMLKQSQRKKGTTISPCIRRSRVSINKSMGFKLTKIREYNISLLEKDLKTVILYKYDVKKVLQEHYCDETQFALNAQQNKSELIFLSFLSSSDVASKINNINTFKSVGDSLKWAMQSVNFEIDNTFCDAANLKRS